MTTYIEPLREFARRPFVPISCRAISAVTAASMMPSGTSLPSRSRIAGLDIRWPTLRTSISERPCRVRDEPSGFVYERSAFNARVNVLPPFETSSVRSPFIRPSQLP
ncbi:hypothetical protein D3C80_1851910 [compost metagenome]